MERLLDYPHCKELKVNYRNNPWLQVITNCFRPKEAGMQKFRFTAEELWLNTFICLDDLIALPAGEREAAANRLWDDLNCELRNEALDMGREFQDEELTMVTSWVVFFVAVALGWTERPDLYRYSETLIQLVARHHDVLPQLTEEYIGWCDASLGSYMQEHLAQGVRLSDRLSKRGADILPAQLPPAKVASLKEEAIKLLVFMKRQLKDSTKPVMRQGDYDRMVEAIGRFVTTRRVEPIEPLIQTNLKATELRYTFYLVWKSCWKKDIERDKVVDFLKATFSQFSLVEKNTLHKKFSEKVEGYSYIKVVK